MEKFSFFTKPRQKIESQSSEEKLKSAVPIRERIVFPHLEPILTLLEKYNEGNEKKIDREIVSDILYAFIEQRIERAGLFEASSHEAAFPWGVTDVAELAKTLFKQYGQTVTPSLQGSTPPRLKKEFMFVTTPMPNDLSSGNQFAFLEEAMHQAFKYLPQALEDLSKGIEPERHEIYTLGAPTNTLGEVSSEFLSALKQDAFAACADIYAEFIEKNISEDEPSSILLYGQSMGASFAAATGNHLKQAGIVTQSADTPEKRQVPFMQVRLDMPVGSSELSGVRKSIQMAAGFVVESAVTAVRDPYLRHVMFQNGPFLNSVQRIFSERGMEEKLSDEQVRLKKEGVALLVATLRSGVPIPEGLKVNKIVGTADPLMYSRDFNKRAEAHRTEYEGSIGSNLVPKNNADGVSKERTFSVFMSHTKPYFRENELDRLYKVMECVQALKERT